MLPNLVLLSTSLVINKDTLHGTTMPTFRGIYGDAVTVAFNITFGGFHMARDNLTYDRFLTCKNPCKDLDLCRFSYMKYSEKCFNQIDRALYRGANVSSKQPCFK